MNPKSSNLTVKSGRCSAKKASTLVMFRFCLVVEGSPIFKSCQAPRGKRLPSIIFQGLLLKYDQTSRVYESKLILYHIQHWQSYLDHTWTSKASCPNTRLVSITACVFRITEGLVGMSLPNKRRKDKGHLFQNSESIPAWWFSSQFEGMGPTVKNMPTPWSKVGMVICLFIGVPILGIQRFTSLIALVLEFMSRAIIPLIILYHTKKNGSFMDFDHSTHPNS